jgi:hypothetical protein
MSVPSAAQPIVDAAGHVTRAWRSFFSGVDSATTYRSVTVSQLPTPSNVSRNFVSDSTVQGEGNFGQIVQGGGEFTVPVWFDPSVTDWRIG